MSATAEDAAVKPEGGILVAWLPYVVLALTIVVWTLKPVKAAFAHFIIPVHWPGLDNVVMKVAPIVAKPTAFAAVWNWDYLPATGTAILVAAFISMFIIRMPFGTWLETLWETICELRYALLTIALVVAFGQLVNYSGMSASMALAFARMGRAFPFVAPILGWIGVFLTGSDTSSNLLFGGLQKITAEQLYLNPVLTIAANSSGGVMGKMISPQSISVGTSATGLVGQEGTLYRFTLKHSLFFLLIICIITYLQAYVFPGMIP
ncbi:hypothetical protein A6M21_10605 [Desulfotomaculum copahuensis]|uniref:L-lactate permease n=1 Tax=Desulfotomaculum copahuensis TaxID=1838280 RepID=A0A1B7LEG3_9FIRM|nr:hypothetical protein A6M21_10605 [Desulfotomaculum copahuensis]